MSVPSKAGRKMRPGTFVCVGVDLLDHEDIASDATGAVGDAFGTWLFALMWTRKHKKDGFVPLGVVRRFSVSDPLGDAETLVGSGFFDRTEGGFFVLKYEVWNDLRAEIETKSNDAKLRMKEAREKRGQKRSRNVRGTFAERSHEQPANVRSICTSSSSSFSSDLSDPDPERNYDPDTAREPAEVAEERPSGVVRATAPDVPHADAIRKARGPDLFQAGLDAEVWAEAVAEVTRGGQVEPRGGERAAWAEVLQGEVPKSATGHARAEWVRAEAKRFATDQRGRNVSGWQYRDWVARGRTPLAGPVGSVAQPSVKPAPYHREWVDPDGPAVARGGK